MTRGRKRRKNEKQPATGPAGVRLDEDRPWVTGRMSLKASPRVMRGPVATETGKHSRRDVETRIMRAMKTLRSLPDRERRFFVVKSGYPGYVQEQIDAYASVQAMMPKFQPTPFDVSDYLRALSWTRHLQKHQWKILWWRSFELSFGLIARYIGRSDETARRNYNEAIIDAWAAANGVADSRAA